MRQTSVPAPGNVDHHNMQFLAQAKRIYEVPGNQSRLVAIEGIRGLAVLLVFFVHFHALFQQYPFHNGVPFLVSRFLGTIGHVGVDLFFVISGYLIYGALMRQPVSYSRFIERRVQRIYPAFLCVLLLHLLLSFFFPQESKIQGPFFSRVAYILQNLFLLPGVFNITPIIRVAWSLSFEFFFYLSLPLLVWFTELRQWRRRSRVCFFAAGSAVYVIYAFMLSASRVRLLMFVAGILLYEAHTSGFFKRILTRRYELAAIVLFLCSLCFAYLIDTRRDLLIFLPRLNAGNTLVPGVSTYQGPYKLICFGVGCFWFLLFSIGYPGLLRTIFYWTPLRYLGNMSYSYYLIHGVTLKALAVVSFSIVPPADRSDWLFGVFLVLGVIATWVSSTILFVTIEKPLSIHAFATAARGRNQQSTLTTATCEQVSAR